MMPLFRLYKVSKNICYKISNSVLHNIIFIRVKQCYIYKSIKYSNKSIYFTKSIRKDIRSGIFLFEMSKNKLFSCDVFTSKILSSSKSSN